MQPAHVTGYNERLFSGGFRTYLHLARYRWLAARLKKLAITPDSVVELGCFDAKLIDFLPNRPRRYTGFDANWEGGLNLARTRWRSEPSFSFYECQTADEMAFAESDRFDIAVIMETLEHMSPDIAEAYLDRVSRHTSGYVFITVPNEIGPLFLAKYSAKRVLRHNVEEYSPTELWQATLGRLERTQPYGHKGFDYRKFVERVSRYVDIVEIEGIPFSGLSPWLAFTVGIVGRSR